MTIEVTEGKKVMLEALPSEVWIQLHTGAPGAAGTANVAGETTRKKVTLAAVASNARKNSTAAEWVGVSTTEKYKYVSLWTAVTGGSPRWAGLLEEEESVNAGDTFKLAIEALSVSLT